MVNVHVFRLAWVLALALACSCASTRVARRFPGCRLERRCQALLGVDCDSAVDGVYLYVREADLEVVATCGGACMSGACTDCPPHAWTCPTY